MSIAEGRHNGGVRRTLRQSSTISAAIGFFLNVVTIIANARIRGLAIFDAWAFLPLSLSLVISHLDLYLNKRCKKQIPVILMSLADAIAFGGFLAILIANGVIIEKRSSWSCNRSSHVLLMSYNSFPWIICAGAHLFMILLDLGRLHPVQKKMKEWILVNATCPECRQRRDSKPGSPRSPSAQALLQDDDDFDEDADSFRKGPISLEDDA